jgi:hypothetical protein
MQLQVGQAVSVFQVLLVIQRGLADVDPDDVRVRIAEREDGGLVSATTCDQDVEIRPIVPVRPEDAVRMHRVEPVPVCCAPRRQVLDGRWVSPPLVLAADHQRARRCSRQRVLRPWERARIRAGSRGELSVTPRPGAIRR